ncbi:hypothetical protein [uncultured Mailhella sp.]|uniref:hypothetical protein n=1 Tax=uncultured Mailhella sp. TaxID=1981031 RepID=UPI0026167680|nr:hypothetical protein [uncultured Mailhella sp.]
MFSARSGNLKRPGCDVLSGPRLCSHAYRLQPVPDAKPTISQNRRIVNIIENEIQFKLFFYFQISLSAKEI